MVCWFFRLLISDAADSDRQCGPVTRRHMRQCAECRRFHDAGRHIGEALQFEAVHLGPGSGHLVQGVFDRFDSPQISGRNQPFRAVLAAAACVALFIGGLALWPRREDARETPTPSIGVSPGAIAARILDNPLTAEVRHLTADAETSIHFLVTCLDVRPATEAVQPESLHTSPPSVQ